MKQTLTTQSPDAMKPSTVKQYEVRGAVGDAKAYPELAKARKPRTPWQWVKRSAAEKEARRILQSVKTE